MKRFSALVLLFVFATAGAAVARAAEADAKDCCSGSSCCEPANCTDADACATPEAKAASTVEADAQRAQMVRELNRLVSTYVLSAQVRTELTKLVADHPERVYRHPVFGLALFNEADQALYTRICDYFDC